MRCKHAEKLIIDKFYENLDKKSALALEKHLANCVKCKFFQRELFEFHRSLKDYRSPVPPKALLEKTTMLCHQELLQPSIKLAEHKSASKEAPIFIWITLLASIVLLSTWALPVIEDYIKDQIVTKYTIYLLMFVIQNGLALLFAPILFRVLKIKKIRFIATSQNFKI